MPGWRKKVETGFEALTRLIYRNRLKTIALVAAPAIFLLAQLPNVRMDASTEGFLHDEDPVLMQYNQFRDQFGRDELIVIAVNPPDVFDRGFLKKLKSFHYDLKKNVPHLDDITSMVNARDTRGEKDELVVEDLLEHFPKSDKEMAVLKKRTLSNPFYKNALISEDGTFTTILIKTDAYSSRSSGSMEDELSGFDEGDGAGAGAPADGRQFLTDEENSETVSAVRAIVDRHNSPDFPVSIAGSPVIINDIKHFMRSDMRRFIGLTLLTIAVLLFLIFRRVSGVVFPLFIVVLSLMSTVGLMTLFSVPIKLPTMILPTLLLAVGVGDSVHVLAIFYNRLTRGDSKQDAIAYAMGHAGLAIVMTSLTTFAGLVSFAWAEISPIADLGIFASAGVLIALGYTIVLLPALVSIAPVRVGSARGEADLHRRMDRILAGAADLATGRPKTIAVVSLVIVAVSLVMAARLHFSHNPLLWLPETMQIRRATALLDDKLKGTTTVEAIINTGKENGLYEPEVLNRLDELARDLPGPRKGSLFIGKTISVADILKETNKALHENRQEFYTIPQNRQLVAQELLLFENSGSDDLEDVVDSRFSMARMTIKVPWLDAYIYGKFIGPFEAELAAKFKGVAQVTLTGLLPIFTRTLAAAINSAAKSYLIAAIVITAMMILLIGDVKIGLISMIPNIAPIIFTLGIMKVTAMPLDMFTMLIGSIAIGIAVDDTIHFMTNFRRYHAITGDSREAVRQTFLTTGRAMLVTSAVLSAGFFIFMFASMNNLFNFGLLTGITIITALLADFLLAPALMILVTKDKDKI